MFRNTISSTPFVTEDANHAIENIVGSTYGSDVSFLSTMRALLFSRVPDGEKVNLIFGSSHFTAAQVSGVSYGAAVNSILGSYNMSKPGQVIVHSFNGKAEDITACFNAIESKFVHTCNGFHNLSKLKAFYHKAFNVDCYVNPDLKSTIVFVENMDNRKMHYLQVSILAFLPWYFDPKKGATDAEMELIKSLRENTSDKYEACLAKMAEGFDFKSAKIRRLLTGFETRFEKKECDNVRGTISRIDSNIAELNRRIGSLLNDRNAACVRLMGLETKIAKAESDDSEIMDYFMQNSHLVLEDVSDSSIKFCVKSYLEYFDQDLAEKTISNDDSFVYSTAFSSAEEDREKVRRLMTEIFVSDNPRLRIRFCAAYKFDLNGNVVPMPEHDFGYEFYGCMPNTHIDEYSCMGNYSQIINTLLMRNDYIGAIEQCIASCKSLNFGDYTVMCSFIGRFLDMGNPQKCIELPDGNIVDAKEAIRWLEEQDKQTEPREAKNADSKEEK